MDDSGKNAEPDFLSSFIECNEAKALLNNLLSVSLVAEPTQEENKSESQWLNRLAQILAGYQEQPYLLDPHLEELIGPIVATFRSHVKSCTSGNVKSYSSIRVKRLAWSLYNFVKVRGHKTVVRFFPHEVSDLPMVIDYMSSDGLVKDPDSWNLRYLMMLWLSLVCMLPFDLAQFDNDDSSTTAETLQRLGIAELKKAGLERDGAALLLLRLYMRKDTSILLVSFLDLIEAELLGSSNQFMIIGSLRVLADMAKSAPMELLLPHLPHIQGITDQISENVRLMDNTVVRKFRTKYISRVATRLLPAEPEKFRINAKSLDINARMERKYDDDTMGAQEVPGEVESAIGDLLELLQDKDSSVRWSSAKGISNICERLSSSFVEEVVDNILGHFSVHGSNLEPSDLPVTAEYPWHGASLACAELARRNLISDAQLPNIVFWMSKALFFDVQKGSSSVGSNVRDAAAYVLWSLARTRSKQTLEPYAIELAQKLVVAALFDREVHIRRAASAAFQENVGRMGLFPHGIAVIGAIDFFSVGIRRHAFLVAAQEVSRYDDYRQPIIDHLLKTTIRHWDEAMRRLGAQSIRRVCEVNLESLVPDILDKLSNLLLSVETADIHGGLLALSELASSLTEHEHTGYTRQYRQRIFSLIDSVPSAVISSPRNYLIAEAACYVISNSISSTEADAIQKSNNESYWRTIILQGLRHRNRAVQEGATAAIYSLSRLKNCSDDTKRLIKELRRSSAIMQQSLARVLGSFDYLSYSNGFDVALPCLLETVDSTMPNFLRDVEARRNAYASLATIIVLVSQKLDKYISPEVMSRIWHLFLAGLEDYTINERGDVGSWIRLSCVKGLSSVLESLIVQTQGTNAHPAPSWAQDYMTFSQYLPVNIYHKAVGMILKQGVERLDNVRQCVGNVFLGLLNLEQPSFEQGGDWSVRGRAFFMDLFEQEESPDWNDGSWLYPRAVCFLNIKAYRDPVLRGLLLSVGSKTSSTQQFALSAMLAYARDLPSADVEGTESISVKEASYDLRSFVSDLLAIANESPKANNVVIPILLTFSNLLEGGILSILVEEERGSSVDIIIRILDLATNQIERLKSIQRVEESMKIVVNMTCISSTAIRERAIGHLGRFLVHPYPKIRSDTAEALYVALQTKDVEYDAEAEELLLQTEWSTGDAASLDESVKQLITCLH